MKSLVAVALFTVAFSFAGIASASTLDCPVGQMVGSVMTDPGVVGTPAVTHQETVIDIPAWDEIVIDTPAVPGTSAFDSFVFVGGNHGDYDQHGSFAIGRIFYAGKWYSYEGHNHGNYDIVHNPATPGTPAVTHTVHHNAETHEITVIDIPAVMAVDPTFTPACVTDPSYVAPVAPAPSTGGTQPWCSSPTAPGWNVSLPNGGCGGTGLFGSVMAVFFNAGETVRGFTCPIWFGFIQCVIR